jgi:hypothetical protein
LYGRSTGSHLRKGEAPFVQSTVQQGEAIGFMQQEFYMGASLVKEDKYIPVI